MGELQIIRAGVATTIHDDGSRTTTPVKRCDECLTDQPTLGGSSTFHFGDEILWICASCRTPK
jgi:hypothetical protein